MQSSLSQNPAMMNVWRRHNTFQETVLTTLGCMNGRTREQPKNIMPSATLHWQRYKKCNAQNDNYDINPKYSND